MFIPLVPVVLLTLAACLWLAWRIIRFLWTFPLGRIGVVIALSYPFVSKLARHAHFAH